MTQLEILNLAITAQLDILLRNKKHYEKYPSQISKVRYEKQQAKYDELHNMIIELEKVSA